MAENLPIRESHLRSILKGVTWRVLATITTVSIAYFFIGNISNALKIGGVEFFGKLLLYYVHERAWQQIPVGTVRSIFSRKNKG